MTALNHFSQNAMVINTRNAGKAIELKNGQLPVLRSGQKSKHDTNEEDVKNDDCGDQTNNNKNNNNNNNNNSNSRPVVTIAKLTKSSMKGKIVSPWHGLVVGFVQFFKNYYNASLSAMLSNLSVHTYSGQVAAPLPPKAFNIIWYQRDYIAANGDTIVFVKTGKGAMTTKKDPGFMPVPFVWHTLNNDIEIIGFKDDYFSRLHTSNVNVSDQTMLTTLSFDVEKRHKDSKVWIPMKAPRVQQA